MGEFIIELKDLWFFSFHGLYEEERRAGGEFKVDLSAKIRKIEKTSLQLKDTVNYVSLYEVIKVEMQKPQALLETVALNISDEIHQKFPMVTEIELYILKKNPPITGFIGTVGVNYKNEFR